MPTLIIRAIGKLQEKWQKEAAETYKKRLHPLTHLDIVELSEGHEGSLKPNIEKTKTKEAEQLLKSIPEDTFIVVLDETGKQFSSQEFSNLLDKKTTESTSIVFLIGGSWGLDEAVKRQANLTLSLGRMTLPHALARIVLLEQIYRAIMIRSGKTYHK